MAEPQFNLNAEDALRVLQAQADKNETQTAEGARNEFLTDVIPETAYDIGYRTCLQDFESVTGDDPREIFLVSIATDGMEATAGPIPPEPVTLLNDDGTDYKEIDQ